MSIQDLDQAINQTGYEAMEKANEAYDQCYLCLKRMEKEDMSLVEDEEKTVWACVHCTDNSL